MKSCFILFVLVCLDFGSTKRSLSKPRDMSVEYLTRSSINIPIMVHMDPFLTMSLAKQFGSRNRKKFKEISHRLLKEVENIFRHRSLNQTIRFTLMDTRFLKNRGNVVSMDENASNYLKSYCDWQSGKKALQRRWYYSVLLTGLDLFYVNTRGEDIRRSTGRGYMGGMCSLMKSCTLIEWHPNSTGFLLAHEIAHSMNINHDGPPLNRCGGNYIMSPQYSIHDQPTAWSQCSRFALKRYLQSGKSRCLRTGGH